MPEELKQNKFAKRAEEAAWWQANGNILAESFEKALNEGYIGPCVAVVTCDSTATKIRLGRRDVAKAHTQALERSLDHQTYLKMIMHDALSNAEAAPTTTNS